MSTVVHADYEWDSEKAATNAEKHGVTFEEASTIFDDLDYLVNRDMTAPDRFVAVGFSSSARVLIVVHVVPGAYANYSARRANLTEEKLYADRQGR